MFGFGSVKLAGHAERMALLAQQYPLGTALTFQGEPLYVVGHTEPEDRAEPTVVLSRLDPSERPDATLKANRIYVAARHLTTDRKAP